MNIVTVSAEVAPWSKVGGLGDVMGALPIALAERGHRVMSVSPRYAEYPDAWDTRQYVDVTLFDQKHRVGFHHVKARGVDRVFLAHPCFLRDGIYGDTHGAYADNQFRYALLSRVAIEAARHLELDGSPYGEEVAFSVNDWHTALVPLFLDALYRPVGLFPRATALLAIHNLAHQGVFGDHTFAGLDLPLRWASQLDMHGVLNTLKGGLVTADRLLTVSPSYAEEIQTPTHGFGLDGLLRARSDHLHGILNGIDTQA
ncbi:MAG: glycogen/starch synthase, partial [Myxococcota bacterium]|nr:glycogen/starch synthase [Myxococcota bacterium]